MKLSEILVTPLQQIGTAGGDVLHAMKRTDAGYDGFGEAYFSWISEDAVKAWKRHTKMTMNVVVPVGRVQFVFSCVNYNGDKEYRIEEIGVNRYARITVPPGIWFGFRGVHASQSLVLNLASIPHDPNEVERKSLADFNFDWLADSAHPIK